MPASTSFARQDGSESLAKCYSPGLPLEAPPHGIFNRGCTEMHTDSTLSFPRRRESRFLKQHARRNPHDEQTSADYPDFTDSQSRQATKDSPTVRHSDCPQPPTGLSHSSHFSHLYTPAPGRTPACHLSRLAFSCSGSTCLPGHAMIPAVSRMHGIARKDRKRASYIEGDTLCYTNCITIVSEASILCLFSSS
jgi:hypothetical protein